MGRETRLLHPFRSDYHGVGNGRVVAAVPNQGLYVIDAASGAMRQEPRIYIPNLAFSRSERTLVGDGDSAFVTVQSQGSIDGIAAIDLGKEKALWASPLGGGGLLTSIGGVLYALDEANLLRAYDAQTGALLSSYGIGGDHFIYQARGASVPLFVGCANERLFALDPSGTPLPNETATIKGTVRCANCKLAGPLPGITVRVGTLKTVTDARGAFSLTMQARGRIPLTIDLPDLNERAGIQYVDLSQLIRLHGPGTYNLGTLTTRQKHWYPTD